MKFWQNNKFVNIPMGIFLIVGTLIVGLGAFLNIAKAQTPWYDSAWQYRSVVTVDNSAVSSVTNLPIKFILDTATLITDNKLKSDCSDIRLTDSDGVTLLPVYMETNSCNSVASVFYGKVPSIASASTTTIYLYYGNPSASANFSWDNVFLPYSEQSIVSSNIPGARYEHKSIFWNNKFWVIGGRVTPSTDIGYKNDVWSSEDGKNWTLVTNNGDFPARANFAIYNFQDKLWIAGGHVGISVDGVAVDVKFSDVWNTSDGITWTKVTENAPWGLRDNMAFGVFNNKMWLIGGTVSVGGVNQYGSDIWSSSDGVSWNQEVVVADWGTRSFASALTFNNKMYLMAGYGANVGTTTKAYKNDVWSSSDGINWTEETSSSGWSQRQYAATAVAMDKMWISAGNRGASFFDDLWYSSDGITWTEVTETAIPTRTRHALVSDGTRLLLIDGLGLGSSLLSDRWQLVRPFVAPEPIISVMVGKVYDITAPVITLNGGNVSVTVDSVYIDAGATALDNVDGDLTSKIIINNLVNTAVTGTYAVTYDVVDDAGNNAIQMTRTVTVVTVPEANYSHVIELKSGWNVISTPRIVASHLFSTSETVENFSVYVLDPTNISGWSTMSEIGQTEFTPLYGYFIYNKTGSNQTLTLNYKTDVSPAQQLFDRILKAGWNVVGVANPDYALKQNETNGADTNNVSSILNSLSSCVSTVLDFTAGETEKNSVKISDVWANKIWTGANLLNDFRETKAYGVYVTSDCNYAGLQNNNSI